MRLLELRDVVQLVVENVDDEGEDTGHVEREEGERGGEKSETALLGEDDRERFEPEERNEGVSVNVILRGEKVVRSTNQR